MKSANKLKTNLPLYSLLFLFAYVTLVANTVGEEENRQEVNRISESESDEGRESMSPANEEMDLRSLDLLAAATMSLMPDRSIDGLPAYPFNDQYYSEMNNDPAAAAYQEEDPAKPAAGQDKDRQEKEDGWEFIISPYLWAPMQKGKTIVGDSESDIDLEFNDIWDALNFAGMLDFQVNKGPWGFQADVLYGDLKDDDTVGPFDLDFGARLWIAEATGSYELTEHWKVLAGVRYYNVHVDIDVDGPLQLSGDKTEDWFDPIVGTAVSLPITDRLSFDAIGDIGGFGLGSDLSYQLWGYLEYRLGEVPSVVLGYRHINWDYKTGSGTTNFEMDTYITGPFLGLRLYF
jgi:hypothetical protein